MKTNCCVDISLQILTALAFCRLIAGDCLYQVNCDKPNTTFIKDIFECRSLNRSTVSDGVCGINPVTKGYIICSDAHNVTEGESNKHCYVIKSEVNPCESYPTDGTFGVCKTKSHGEISENHPLSSTSITIQSTISTTPPTKTMQANMTARDNSVTVAPETTPTNDTNSQTVLITVAIIVILIVIIVCGVILYLQRKGTSRCARSSNTNVNETTSNPAPQEQDPFVESSC